MRRLTLWVGPTALLLLWGCGPDCDFTQRDNLCTLAGDGTNGYGGDEGPALAAKLSLPQDTLIDAEGNLLIIDWNNHRLRKRTADGMLRHLAGRGELGGSLDDPALSDFNHPTGILADPTGAKLYVAAWHNSKIRRVDLASGEIEEVCGDGRRAYFGDNGPAPTATLDLPASIAWHPEGDLLIMDQANQVLRAIDAQGVIRKYAGRCVIDAPQPAGPGPCLSPVACPAPSGKFTCGDPATTCGLPCTPGYAGDDGPASELRMAQPFGQSADPAGRIAFDAQGNLYFADTGNAIIRKIDRQGVVRRVAGKAPIDGKPQRGYAGDEGPALEALLNNPVDLDFGSDGTLYFTDVYNHCVRAVAPDGIIRTVAGSCGQAGAGERNVPPTQAKLKRPYGLDVHEGVLYISDTGNNLIRAMKL